MASSRKGFQHKIGESGSTTDRTISPNLTIARWQQEPLKTQPFYNIERTRLPNGGSPSESRVDQKHGSVVFGDSDKYTSTINGQPQHSSSRSTTRFLRGSRAEQTKKPEDWSDDEGRLLVGVGHQFCESTINPGEYPDAIKLESNKQV